MAAKENADEPTPFLSPECSGEDLAAGGQYQPFQEQQNPLQQPEHEQYPDQMLLAEANQVAVENPPPGHEVDPDQVVRPRTPAGRDYEVHELRETVQRLAGNMDTLLRRLQPVGPPRATPVTDRPGSIQVPRDAALPFPIRRERPRENAIPGVAERLRAEYPVHRPMIREADPMLNHIGAHQRKPRLPREYTGKEEVWEDYLKHFEGVAFWNRWGDLDKAEALYLSLSGSAASYVYSQPGSETATYAELCAFLASRYGAARNAAVDRKRLRDRRKQKGETYAEVGQDILRLATRVYKGAPDVAEREGRDYFIRTLPPQLRMAVAAADPVTVNDCIDMVTRLCVTLDTDEESSDFRKVRRVGQVAAVAEEEQKPQTSQNPVNCWDCGQDGHVRRNCPHHFKYRPKNRFQRPPGKPRQGQSPSAQGPTEVKEARVGNELGPQ